MRRNHKLESELAEKIVGYVLVNTDDYFAAEKQLELAQQTNNSVRDAIPALFNKWLLTVCQSESDCNIVRSFLTWAQEQHP